MLWYALVYFNVVQGFGVQTGAQFVEPCTRTVISVKGLGVCRYCVVVSGVSCFTPKGQTLCIHCIWNIGEENFGSIRNNTFPAVAEWQRSPPNITLPRVPVHEFG
ncbi:hypothetical protein RRG08_006453 [Elysia crispata]|uniref:Uncharacterized protein n=1 Tax=Elysia crispata TaxID=231223 RepID=A0AAE1DIJ4_9GAST|nr:hypothetical protein RRG08_006453 [Elysia crispata]